MKEYSIDFFYILIDFKTGINGVAKKDLFDIYMDLDSNIFVKI